MVHDFSGGKIKPAIAGCRFIFRVVLYFDQVYVSNRYLYQLFTLENLQIFFRLLFTGIQKSIW